MEEVLLSQHEDIREFLFQTSILEQFTAALCDHLLDRSDSQQIIGRLVLNNMFLVPMDQDRNCFRYHHLFSDLLRQRLHTRAESGPGPLYEKASLWFEEHGMTALAIVIASLGILGLASFSVEQRTREIGIRKVSGSSGGRIMLHIFREFSILVLIANLFAWPVAWYFMRNWLMDFPIRIGLCIHFFLLAGFLALFIAMITVYFQGRRAARMNPAEALRSE